MPQRTALSAIVILNSKSGKRSKSDLPQKLRSIATDLGVTCEIVTARTPAKVIEAARQAAHSNHDIVIAGGGDGTINAVASELIGTGKSLGVLPLGTFNYFAREIGVPLDFEAAFRACFGGKLRSVSVGEVNGRIFLNNASIGLYPVILAVREKAYRRWGRSRVAAYASVLTAVLRLRVNMKLAVTLNGERRIIRTPLLFVARNAVQLEEFRVPGVQCVSDDGFSVFALRPLGKLGLLRVAWRTLIGKLEPRYDFTMACMTAMHVESDRMLRSLAFDGERVKMLAPLEFRMRQDALSVVVPEKTEEAAA